MATLTFSIGQLTSTITANNAKAATVFRNAALNQGYSGDIDDNQAVADFVMGQLRRVLTDWSSEYQERIGVRAAIANARGRDAIRFEE